MNNNKKISSLLWYVLFHGCICIYKSREDTGAKPRLRSSKSFQLYCLENNNMASRSVIAPLINYKMSETKNEHCVIRGKDWKICMPFHRCSAREKPPQQEAGKSADFWSGRKNSVRLCDWIELLCKSAASKDGHNC